MPFQYEIISCQNPKDPQNIIRDYLVVKAVFNNTPNNLSKFINKAWDLAQKVNPHKANNSTDIREKERLILDSMGGVLSESAWFYYINKVFGDGTVKFTEFNDITAQIDLKLSNGKTIEIRSSFPRNGVKFAICNERYNFKNICKYSNLYKPSEIDKDFFGCVLFQTTKENIIKNDNEIVLYLIGGSTKSMMLNDKISFVSNLVAEDDITQTETQYKVIRLKDALDMAGFNRYMIDMGYKPIINDNTVEF